MNRIVKAILLALAICLLGFVCTRRIGYEPPPIQYSIRFFDGETQLESQTVSEGGVPMSFTPEREGLLLLGWTDAHGAAAEPFAAVTGDGDYYARWRPVLGEHEPYLFADENGLLRPDDALTRGELNMALRALCADEAEEYLMEFSPEQEEVSGEDIAAVLREYFPDSAERPDIAGDGLSRYEFAELFNRLLGRESHGISAASGALMPPDIGDGEWRGVCLEACMAHSDGVDSWETAKLEAAYEPGFVHFGGQLFCVGSDGGFTCDADVGVLHFGPDGSYTCGDETLDGYIDEIIAGFIEASPDAEPLELLRMAYDYTRDSFEYLRRSAYAFGQGGWEISDAKTMLETGRGNCYCYAGVFWALARQLGYEARAINGTISSTYQPHAWVEIEIDGVNYYFDPETEMTYVRKNESRDMFMMERSFAMGWFYRE